MTGTVLLTVAALAAIPADVTGNEAIRRELAASPFARAIRGEATVLRGQSPTFTGPVLGEPQPVTTFYQTPTYGAPGLGTPGVGAPATTPYYDPSFGNAMPGVGAPYTSDPWLNGGVSQYGAGGNPYPGTVSGAYAIGLNGAQPFKLGWTERFDVGWIADADTNIPGGGSMNVLEANYEKEYTTPIFGNWIFSAAGQYNMRAFNGPYARRVAVGDTFPTPGGFLPAAPELPGNAHRFGLGLKLRTPTIGLWTFEGGFNPSLATDFSSSLNSDAVLYDGHVVAFLRPSPVWTFAIGAAYWDRVDSMVIPYAGVVFTPNDYLEVRLVFPKPRVSLFLGTPLGLPTWGYVQGEYHVEAYQVGINGPAARDLSGGGLVSANELIGINSSRVQIEDWRIMGGFYTEGPAWTGFVEAGAAIEREVKYSSTVSGFDVDPGFIIRMGVRY